MNILSGFQKVYLSRVWITEYIRDLIHFIFLCLKEDNFVLCFILDVTFSFPGITTLYVALHFQTITVKYTAAKPSDT